MKQSWEKTRQQILTDNPLCQVCTNMGITTGAVEVDHIVPLSLGGTNHTDNLQPICRECHERKTAMENRLTLQVGLDGFPKQEMRKQILLRRDKHKNAIRRYWRDKREKERQQALSRRGLRSD